MEYITKPTTLKLNRAKTTTSVGPQLAPPSNKSMPPIGGPSMAAKALGFDHRSDSAAESNIVTIDVGGQLFQTTKQTLSLAGPSSLISRVSESPSPFVDRDPELFSVLLSLLRTGNLPSRARVFDIQDLIFESRFYGIESLLIDSVSNPSQFEPFNLERSSILRLNGRDSPSAIATTSLGSVHVAHGSKITSFDWSLGKKNTILTHFSAVDSLLAVSPTVAAAGATDFSGLQIVDLENGAVKETLNWVNSTRSSSTVQAIGSNNNELLFVSFESGRRNSNTIMVYDMNTLGFVAEIGQNEIYGSEIGSAIPATKLNWAHSHSLLMASGSHSGPSGVNGNIKFWDLRSKDLVFEIKEDIDCFSDITVSDNLSAMFKVGMSSGEVFFADLRNLGRIENPWMCLGDKAKGFGGKRKEGFGCKIESHGRQVFCSKGGDIELWSEVSIGIGDSKRSEEVGFEEDRVFRKNLMGKVKDSGGDKITNLGFGGNKMFVTRKDQQCVEVWQSLKFV